MAYGDGAVPTGAAGAAPSGVTGVAGAVVVPQVEAAVASGDAVDPGQVVWCVWEPQEPDSRWRQQPQQQHPGSSSGGSGRVGARWCQN